MEARITARSLFFGAIGDLLTNFGAVLRIGGAWFALYVALSALAGRLYAHWVLYDVNNVSLAPPSEWYVSLAFVVMLGMVAAAWHRFMVLREVPGFIPRMRLVIIVKYVLAWIVIGIVIGLILLIAVGLPALLLVWVFADGIPGQMAAEAVIAPDFGSPGGLMVIIVLTAAIVLPSTYLLFRMGIGLPSVAILDGEGIGMRASWRATRDMAWPILGASLLASLGMLVLYGLSFALLLNSSETYTTAGEVTGRVAIAVTDIVTMMVGTAILTRIYRAVPEASL